MLARYAILMLVALAALGWGGPARGSEALPRVLYSTRDGAPVVTFVPLGEAAGPPRRISPTGLSAYGPGDSWVEVVAVPRRGDRVVLQSGERSRARRLYTVATDGSDAETPSLRYELRHHATSESAFNEDGTRFAFIDGLHLVVVDTSGPPRAVILDEAPQFSDLRLPRWVGDQVVYNVDQRAMAGRPFTAWVRAVDGSGGTPRDVTAPTPGEQHRVVTALPDGRLILAISGVFFAVDGQAGEPVRLTPRDAFGRSVGVVGEDLYLTLATSPRERMRRLVRVRLDGSSADRPVAYTEPIDGLRAFVSPQGVAWSERTDPTHWALFASPLETPAPRRVTPDLEGHPQLAALTAAGDAVLGCDEAQAVARFDLGPTPAPPVRLGPVPARPICSWIGQTEDGWLVYEAPMEPGATTISSFAVRVDGQETVPLVGRRARLADGGVVFLGNQADTSVRWSDGGPVGPALSDELREAHLAPGAATLIYRTDAWSLLDLATGRTTPLDVDPDAPFLGATADHAVFDEPTTWVSLTTGASGATPCNPTLVAWDAAACLAVDLDAGKATRHRFGPDAPATEPLTVALPRSQPRADRYDLVDAGTPMLGSAFLPLASQHLVLPMGTSDTAIPHARATMLLPLGEGPAATLAGFVPVASPRTRHLLLLGKDGLYVAPSDGSSPPARLVAGPPRLLGGAPLSPDGRRLAWMAGDALAVADLDARTTRTHALQATWAAWSSDSRTLAFEAGGRVYALVPGASEPTAVAGELTAPRLVGVARGHALVLANDAVYAAPWDGGPGVRLTPEEAHLVRFLGVVDP